MIELNVEDRSTTAASLTQIKLVAMRFPGEHRLTIVLPGGRQLTLGPEWLYDGSPVCVAALSEFGEVISPHAAR